ncbi:MAG: hypothetical protein IPN38_18470 [Flavobacteriales bacterium]|nr:hypothetical protein [Flavobacteriales bacterium]
MKHVHTLLTILVLAGLVIAMTRIGTLESRLRAAENVQGRPTPLVQAAPAPDFEVAIYMGRIQVYMHKLYWAGMAKNLPLAEFYRHEIKEVMEEVAKAGVVEDGINVSEKMSLYGIRTIDGMKAHFKEKGLEGFTEQYAGLVNTCNTCHRETGHPMIQVQVPMENRYTDQVFVP